MTVNQAQIIGTTRRIRSLELQRERLLKGGEYQRVKILPGVERQLWLAQAELAALKANPNTQIGNVRGHLLASIPASGPLPPLPEPATGGGIGQGTEKHGDFGAGGGYPTGDDTGSGGMGLAGLGGVLLIGAAALLLLSGRRR